MSDLKYMHGCTLCGDGVVSRMEELMAEGLAESKAAVAISNEITKTLGEEMYSFSAIKSRYRRLTGRDTPDDSEPDFEGLEEKDAEYVTVKDRMAAEVAKKKKKPKEEAVGTGLGVKPMMSSGPLDALSGPQWEWIPEDMGIKTYRDACWYVGGDELIRPEANLFLLDKAFETFGDPEGDEEVSIFRQVCLCKKIIEKHIKKNF
jgi:hypothetical protein